MISAAKLTSCGGRSENEDSILFTLSPKGFFGVVADGLGGHGNGEIASSLSVNSFLKEYKNDALTSQEEIRTVFKKINEEILNRHVGKCHMKTTSVILKIEKDIAQWAHTGDSRLYHFQNQKLKHQTFDHSVSQMAVLMGEIKPEQIRFHEDRNRILRALGSENWEPTISQKYSIKDDFHAFLLCSDGFWEYVYESEMEKGLEKSSSPEEWLSYMEKLLLSRVTEENDNYTALAVFVKK